MTNLINMTIIIGLERQGRGLARKYRTQLIEYWPFLDAYCDITSNGGLQMLENYFQEKEFEKESQTVHEETLGVHDETLGLGEIELKLANLKINVSQDNVDNINANENRRTDVNSNQDLGVLNLLNDEPNRLPVSTFI